MVQLQIGLFLFVNIAAVFGKLKKNLGISHFNEKTLQIKRAFILHSYLQFCSNF